MSIPHPVAPTLDSLKLALGRLERATTRVELALRKGAAAPADGMTSAKRKNLENGLESAIDRIDAILKDAQHG